MERITSSQISFQSHTGTIGTACWTISTGIEKQFQSHTGTIGTLT